MMKHEPRARSMATQLQPPESELTVAVRMKAIPPYQGWQLSVTTKADIK